MWPKYDRKVWQRLSPALGGRGDTMTLGIHEECVCPSIWQLHSWATVQKFCTWARSPAATSRLVMANLTLEQLKTAIKGRAMNESRHRYTRKRPGPQLGKPVCLAFTNSAQRKASFVQHMGAAAWKHPIQLITQFCSILHITEETVPMCPCLRWIGLEQIWPACSGQWSFIGTCF